VSLTATIIILSVYNQEILDFFFGVGRYIIQKAISGAINYLLDR
jgi:hypothetical protein